MSSPAEPKARGVQNVFAEPRSSAAASDPEVLSAALDGRLHAAEGRLTGGLSFAAVGQAFADWGIHLANAPFRRIELAKSAVEQWARFAAAAGGQPAIARLPADPRFRDPAWQQAPFNLLSQCFLLGEEWWAQATTGPSGVSRTNQRIVSFGMRQFVDVFSPSNIPWLNPEVIQATAKTGGKNFLLGAANLLADIRDLGGHPSAEFQIGQDLAATPGKVVFRNELIELIQVLTDNG